MQVAVLGAGGKAGSELVKELVSRGHSVRAIGRNEANLPSGERIEQRVADVSTADGLADAVEGCDAVISALHFDVPFPTFKEGLEKAGVERVIFTGGAASLNNPDGKRVYDSEHFPDFLRPIVKPAIDFLDDLRGERKLNWTFFSPAMNFVVGERRGTFRLGKDEMVYDAEGKSEISYADAAIAMVDELEQENNPRGRFTAAY